MTGTTALDVHQPSASREHLMEQVARLWAEGIAAQADRSAADAARAAGARTPAAIAVWVAEHRADLREATEAPEYAYPAAAAV